MKTNLNIKKRVSIVPIFTGLIFAGILGIRTANNSNRFVVNSNEKQNALNTYIGEKEKIIELTGGSRNAAALTNEGNAYTWGDNNSGQIGDGSTHSWPAIPTKITDNFNLSGDEKISQLRMGDLSASAITNEGNVFTWGDNDYGQLGDGSKVEKTTPTNITDNFKLSGEEQVTQLYLVGLNSTALTNEGNVFTWGNNNYGQLGDGSKVEKTTPTKITDKFNLSEEEKITQLSSAGHTLSALTNKGNVYAWGLNYFSQIGDGTEVSKHTPTKITDKFNLLSHEEIVQLSMGQYHSSALTNQGNVYTWGINENNQLGDGSKEPVQHTPVKITHRFPVSPTEKISQLSMGTNHSSALTNWGNVYTWGDNSYGQLGNSTIFNKNTPTKITNKFNLPGDEHISKLSMGSHHSSALTSEGDVYTWGSDTRGQLARFGDKTIPMFARTIQYSFVRFNNISNLTTNSVTINFNVSKNTQKGNVIIKDKNGKQKAKKDNVDGSNSITIDGLDSSTTYSGWTIEVDGNNKKPIKDFTTLSFKSEILSHNLTDITTNSVTINFYVDKKDQSGNVIIKDKNGKQKGKKDNVDGSNSITIDGLDSSTTYSGWTIEVDENGEIPIKNFTTLLLKSEILSHNLTDITTNSVTINFNVAKNNQSGNVIIKDKNGKQKGKKDNVDGSNSITINGLKSNTTHTGWRIEVDENGEIPIKDFKTLPISSKVTFNKITDITTSSVRINFNVIKNEENGNVVIKDKNGKEKGKKDNVDGSNSITINGLKSNTTYTGWRIEVDGNGVAQIKDFTTNKHISSDIEEHLEIKTKGEIKSSDKEITLIYESNQQLNGIWEHTITYKNGEKQITSSSNDKYSVNNTNNTIKKTYSLDQSIENIEKIETIYEIDGYDVLLDTYTGPADKVLVIKETKPGLSPGAITGIVLGSITITGVALIVLMIYFLVKKNRIKTQ